MQNAFAGVAITDSKRSCWRMAFGRFDVVRRAVARASMKRATSSPMNSSEEPSCTVPFALASASRRLKERACVKLGSRATASASKPKRSSPARSATTEGNHSTESPASLSKVTTG